MIQSIADRIVLLHGWRAAFVAILAGAATALALAPVHATPIIWLTFPVLVWLMDGALPPADEGRRRGIVARLWPAFRTGWCFGFGYHVAGLWWIGRAFLVEADTFAWLLPLAVLALPAGLAIFMGLGCALARIGWRDTGAGVWFRIVALAGGLTIAEYARGTVLTGFPWDVLGTTIMPVALAMQASALIGSYGMTFLAVLIGAMPALATSTRLAWPVLAVLVVAPLGYGAWRMAQDEGATQPGIALRIVQPAIAQEDKWEPKNADAIMDAFLDGSNSDTGPKTASVAAFTHVIWPESAFPFILTQRPDRLAQIAALLPPGTTLLTGAMRMEDASGNEAARIYNSLLAIDDSGTIVATADKTQLVPFGEYLPFRAILSAVGMRQLVEQSGFAEGARRRLVSLQGTPAFLPLICYEIIFSGALVPSDESRPGWIVNLTNDAWFGITSGPYQHAHQSRIRAVETGLPVVRAANSGISMIVTPYGEVLADAPLGVRGVVDGPLPAPLEATPFVRFGNGWIMLCICLMTGAAVVAGAVGSRRL